jgi:uncharacterized membrane protein YkoI
MKHRTKYLIAGLGGAVVVAGAGVGVGVAATGDDETERPITPVELDRASEAALEHTGGGRVTGSEVGDENSYYEVEVTLEDGTQVDVQLDEDFTVVGVEEDDLPDDD